MRNFLIPLSLILLFVSAGCATEPNFPPGLPSGEVEIKVLQDTERRGERFDFETGRIVTELDAAVVGDIFFDRKFLCGSGEPLHVGVQDTQPQSIGADPTAPTTGYTFPLNRDGVPARVGVYVSHVYWIKLTDGKYAKIKIKDALLRDDASDYKSITFEWVYQPDGSTDFKGKPEAEKSEE
ncbi:HmuY family protein [bacterium]|nr:HmuY family protein [bacterium]MBU1024524.1 HmuY family protein [bacterium]